MSKKRILTWHPNKARGNGRWRKYVDGVVRYFGTAKSPNDNRAYREAERKYLEFMQKRETALPVTIACSQATISDVREKLLQDLNCRYERGDVSASYVEKARCCLNDFIAYVGMRTRFASIGELILDEYRSHTLALPMSQKTGRRISPATAKDRLSMVHTVYRWAWKMRIIDTLPRNLDGFAKVTIPKTEAKVFSLEEIHALWNAADPRLRCWMALGLNCGYGQQDISDLRVDEVDWANGQIDRLRSKSGVQAKHRLWDITLDLMRGHRAPNTRNGDRIFITKKGNPLVWGHITDGRLRQSDSVRCWFWRLQRELGINGGRGFYSLRRTGATLIEQIDPAVTEMYLAHAERGMKQAYAQRDWERLGRAIVELELRLELPP